MSKNDDNKVYDILAFAFAGQDTAKQNLKDIKSSGVLDSFEIVAQAVVEQDAKGKVHVHEPGPAAGGVVGGVAGKYLGRPISKGDLKEIGEALTPNSSALLLLLEDTYSEGVIGSMGSYNANVVTLTVGDDLSGEIESYMAADTGDDGGSSAGDASDTSDAASS
jgi:uncharacterized membrane protein